MDRGGEQMSDEISQAIQIIRLEFDGLRFGMDVTGGTVKQAKNLAVFIYALLTREKIQGKTSLKKMLSKDGSLQVLKIREEDMKKFKKLAKKYGILYSKLPDINKSDGMTEVLFHTEATPRINTLIEKLGNGSIVNLMDYVRNGKDGDFEKVVDYLKKENILKDTPSEVEPERKEQLDRYADELKYNAMINDPSRVDITISRKLYEEENLTSIKTRVPNTYGDNVRYLWIDKSDVVSINGGKTFFAYLNKDEEYELVDRDGQIAEKLTGQNLQKQHYDNVDVNVKHRALQEQRRGKSEKKQKDKKVGTPGPKVRKTESVKGSPRGR